eukprot:scaffold2611_cov114-Isochrysis_galbana.AAC.7
MKYGSGASLHFSSATANATAFTPRRKRYSLAATWLDTSVLLPSGHRTLPLPSPILSPSRLPYLGRYERGMASELRALQQPGLEY